MKYEVAIQTKDLRMSRIVVTDSRADAIKSARAWARDENGEVAWVHVFSLASGQSIFSMQALTPRLA